MSKISFGTDGWRAIIAEDFTFANIKIVTQGIANYIKNQNLSKKGIVIGYDNRFLSEHFALECARVLLGNGINTITFKKSVPTPLTAYAIYKLKAGGGIMITASHNPPEYNGIKFIPEYAGPALPEVTAEIEAEIQKVVESEKIYELDIKEARALELFTEVDMEKDYIQHLMHLFVPPAEKRETPLKVVVDPMFGAGVGYLDKILNELGCEVRTINNYRDPLFGDSMPEPIDRILTDLKRAVISYKADIGLALDGDADRFGIINSEGDYISANQFTSILLQHLLRTRSARGPISRSLATTHMLDKVARDHGLNIIETPVGFKYIGKALREKACILGVEESGGLSIIGHVPEKDGILACLLAVEMLLHNNDKNMQTIMQEFEAKYGQMLSERIDIKITSEKKRVLLEDIAQWNPRIIAGIKVESNKMDNVFEGKKIILEDGSWLLMRPSGTEAVLRIYIETIKSELMKEIKQELQEEFSLDW
jgi:alpha-D-glucose phosphate-specific phosphoglucomutase